MSNTTSDSSEFHAVSSFGIPERLYFALLGNIVSGNIADGMYAHITLNSSLAISVKINEVTAIEIPNDTSADTLLISYCADKEWYDFLLSMNVSNENVSVDFNGAD
ncbi:MULTISPECIES: hypothetical protein [Niastella]|uniref:Uncharacterized protein n=1 Tax=Niastella soli TaxID=2821487 RepID=A0ABS3YSZ8_9BACT|nr:hypothetical protein [Niastella soli]MBO9200560.1 hypothetical protein [Niastella soli]